MKIIAAITDGEFLIQASQYEIARIEGCYGNEHHNLKVGREIAVSDLYECARTLVSSSDGLHDYRDKLCRLVAAIDKFTIPLEPIAAAIKPKVK